MTQNEHQIENSTSLDLAGKSPQERLTLFLEETLLTVGYELVAIEVFNHREKKLRVFIDAKAGAEGEAGGIGIEDCVRATQALDLPLETNTAVNEVFSGPYELEVSSPGVDRPLRKPEDFTRFTGEVARLHTFRPLTADETSAAEYSTKNPKQKNFYGVIRGFDPSFKNGSSQNGAVLFGAMPEDGTRELFAKGTKSKGKKKAANLAESPSSNETLIRLPLELISKANLEPQVKFPD